MNDQILIILDLDETLVHATTEPQNEDWSFEVGKYKVYIRPHLPAFLELIKDHFRVAVWSSASDDYVRQIVAQIFPKDYNLAFVWARSMCTLHFDSQTLENHGYSECYSHLNYIKNLKKIKKRRLGLLERTLIIDDTPRKSKFNYGNAIYPKEFKGDQNDDELDYLGKYLLTLREVDNVRTIEKREWKSKVKRNN